ncbi:flagellar type III secretion system pore protein FliP [Alkalibacter mobilis]|uniref:flagellar type III secretion system pore protein FliP n=1 Tax=Alkalibacter mobilis TaxID=2787712 RepID=UPI0018A04FCD|nr:flagellar type III secretion system pore protein FliP [Alkalibacter mobilis]MBF7096310.1 flagellar type III secretion system pore protein FliP [Alkalibacter mobilis]
MNKRQLIIIVLLLASFAVLFPDQVSATGLDLSDFGINFSSSENEPQALVDTVKVFILLTVLTLVPAFLILTTCFTRVVVVLSFLRSAIGSQQTPPNQVLMGLALFITLFVMQPVYTQVMDQAVTPYLSEEITQEEAFDIGSRPIKKFMLEQTREKDLALFMRASNMENLDDPMELSFTVIVPAFTISELRMAFSIGFILFLPFLVMDIVVSSILMSMGMFMLPPVMISLPFKLLLFILVDGWYLVVESLLRSFS